MPSILALTLARAAHSQTFDAHGPALPPDGPSVRDPLFGFGARLPGAPILGIVGEGADSLLVREVVDGGVLSEQPVLDDLFGIGAEVMLPISERVALAATLPLWLGSEGEAGGGVAPGDVQLWAPVRLYDRGGPRLAALPFLTLPTGADARYLGDAGPGVGLLASAGADLGPLSANLDAGLDATLGSGVPDWPGGLSGRFATAVGVAPTDSFGVHLEWRGRAPLFRALPGVPTEAMLGIKARPEPRFWLTAGVGTAVTRGIGAAGLRLEVGAHAALGKKEVDAAIVEAARPAELHVIDERRWPIRGAVATVGSTKAETDHEGYADLPARTWKVGEIVIVAEGFEPAALTELAPESMSWEIVLVRKPVPVAVSVVGPQGATPDVAISITGDKVPAPPTVDEAGVHNYALPPGTYTVTMEAPGLGTQERTLVVTDERTEPIRVDAVLAPAAAPGTRVVVEVVDRMGIPVEDAVVAIEAGDLGTTGTGGDVVVQGLAPGETSFVVRSTDYVQDAEVTAVVTSGDTTTVTAVLDWPPGAVVVKVFDPGGRPVDARVAFSGPANLPSRAVGSDGEEMFVLRPGEWDVLVSSPTLGAQQRHVTVTDRPGGVTELEFVLLPFEKGTAELELRVTDVDGQPLSDVRVSIDDQDAGRTGPDGSMVLFGLDAGDRFVDLEGELLVPKQTEVSLSSGRQVEPVTLWFVSGVVDVTVSDLVGSPLDALVAFAGPTEIPAMATGPDGHGRAVLTAGSWQVAASNEAFGTQVRDLTIPHDDRRAHRLSITMLAVGEEVGRVILTAVDPMGRPISGASASVDGRSIGTLTDGPLTFDLPLGPSEITVEAELHLSTTREMEIGPLTPVNLVLPWATGVLEVNVTGPAGPKDALVLVSGPEAIPPRQAVGGTARFGLTAGTWSVLASEPGYGADQRTVVIPPTPKLSRVDLVLDPIGVDEGEILLTVEDPDGRPIPGVSAVVVGGTSGRTSEGGTVELADLDPGTVAVALAAPEGFVGRTLPIKVERGQQDRVTVVLPYAPQPVAVNVTGPDGAPLDATIEIVGPGATTTHTTTAGTTADRPAGTTGGTSTGDPSAGTTTAGTTTGGTTSAGTTTGGTTSAGTTAGTTSAGTRAGTSEPAPVRSGAAGEATLALAPGTYLVTATTPTGVATTEVVVERGKPTTVVALAVETTTSTVSAEAVTVSQPLLFDVGRHELGPATLATLDDLARRLRADRTAALVEVQGHTSEEGGVAYNQALSERRAAIVLDALVARGVPAERLMARGYGLSRPVTTGTDEVSRARNRRVELVVIETSR